MARSSRKGPEVEVAKQRDFHPLLVAARKTKLESAVSAAAANCDSQELRTQIGRLAHSRVLQLAAAAGIRDEHVVVTPCLLKQMPSTLGYYRLLLGISRKQFYRTDTGFGPLKNLEDSNILRPKQELSLEAACATLNSLIEDLVLPLGSYFSPQDIHDLPLLQLGAQLDGANRVKKGQIAAAEVFSAMSEILRGHLRQAASNKLEVTDAVGVTVTVRCASDPDIEILRHDGSQRPRRIAIEIKGGTDLSNANNRAGEAEKSHLTAKAKGATEFWTVASMPTARLMEFQRQSPTTNIWFELSQVLGRSGSSWEEFRRQIAAAVGVNLK